MILLSMCTSHIYSSRSDLLLGQGITSEKKQVPDQHEISAVWKVLLLSNYYNGSLLNECVVLVLNQLVRITIQRLSTCSVRSTHLLLKSYYI